jgi:uncharacterized protein
MNSCLYEGVVRHRRFTPALHSFRYSMFMLYLDLAELPLLFRKRWLWSIDRPNLAWFCRRDHLGDPSLPLDRAVGDLIEEKTGKRPSGPIRLLTHLRYFGYGFNPVSFYFCFDRADACVETIVAEVNNTPWGEQHCYVLDDRCDEGVKGHKRFRFSKEFHVSPFMEMDLNYDWRFSRPAAGLAMHMENIRDGRTCFDATMALRRTEIQGASLARVLVQYPLMTVKVIAAIYAQALRLRLKRVPVYAHPRQRASSRRERRCA